MATVALDSLEVLLAAPEGRYEVVDGRLAEMPPSASGEHGREMLFLAQIMNAYAERHGLGVVYPDGFAQRLDGGTVRIPDVAFFRAASLGRVKPTHSDGGADLVVEIVSPDSRGRDRGDKFYDYERAGVEEYWIVDPERRSAEFYRLRDGLYAPVLPDAEGRVASSALPGFALRVEWLWDRPTLLDALGDLGLL